MRSEAGTSAPSEGLHPGRETARLAPVVHLTYREGMAAVFMSQVVTPMSRIRSLGRPVELVVFAPLGQRLRRDARTSWRERCRAVARDFGLPISQLASPPSRARRLWNEAPVLKRWLQRRFHAAGSRVILHCRGPEASGLALDATAGEAQFDVLFDCRGASAEEHLYVRGYRSRSEAPSTIQAQVDELALKERRAAQACRMMICVSHAMRRVAQSRWDVPENKIAVIPCSTDVTAGRAAAENRDGIRQGLGLGNRFVVAYCGSLAPWQMPVESIQVFKTIAGVRSDAHLLAVTTQPEKFATLAEELGVPAGQRTVLSVPHRDVPRYLAAADVGLLIREASPVNEVASPVKFAEYLACGVPVLLTRGIGDYSKLVEEQSIGHVIDGVRAMDASDFARFRQHDAPHQDRLRQRCLDVASRQLSWETAIERLERVYAGFSELARR